MSLPGTGAFPAIHLAWWERPGLLVVRAPSVKSSESVVRDDGGQGSGGERNASEYSVDCDNLFYLTLNR